MRAPPYRANAPRVLFKLPPNQLNSSTRPNENLARHADGVLARDNADVEDLTYLS